MTKPVVRLELRALNERLDVMMLMLMTADEAVAENARFLPVLMRMSLLEAHSRLDNIRGR
jgi:hypothetical protein